MEINLKLQGEDSLSDKHLSKNKFRHRTGNQIKLLPFTTRWNRGLYNDFVYFKGIIGECFRIVYKQELTKELLKEKNYNHKLKEIILEKANELTDAEQKNTFKRIINDLFFDENNLVCFSKKTLPYLSLRNNNSTLKEISAFIYDIFFDEKLETFITENKQTNGNVLYHLMEKALPNLAVRKEKNYDYYNCFSEISQLFKKDFEQISKNENIFLKEIENLIKYYYFFYISQLAFQLNDFFETKSHKVYFMLETEVVSKTRHGFQFGWQYLERKLGNLFSHANALELINYLEIDGKKPELYQNFKMMYAELSSKNQNEVIEKIEELSAFYQEAITKPNTGWEECFNQLDRNTTYNNLVNSFEKAVYKFWYMVDYQFLHTARKKPYDQYKTWFTEFCKANFLKRRGRSGYTLNLSQEMLILLTKLCIGNSPKIRLKTLWERLSKRGVNFDEPSKMEVIRLFEKINLIEKKSDSGDAQYVRAIL